MPEAKKLHVTQLRAQPNGILLCADAALNPVSPWLYTKWRKWREAEIGGVKFDAEFYR